MNTLVGAVAAVAALLTVRRSPPMMISVPGDRSVAAEIEGLNHRLKIPKGLGTLGVPRDKLPWVIERALEDHSHVTNPRPVTRDDYARLLADVMV